MKKSFLILPVLLVSLMFACSSGQAGDQDEKSASGASEITTQGQKLSYAIGFSVGQKVRTDNIEGMDLDVLVKGLKDAIADKDPALSEEEIGKAFNMHRQQQAEKSSAQGGINLKKAEEFLKHNETKKGVKTLEKGMLQYKVIKSGKGKKSPSMTDQVELHYKGTTMDGEEFDSSHKRGQPAIMSGNKVIPGFGAALTKMKEGDKWEIYIHPSMAYGPRSPGPGIPPNALLIFEIEVLSIK